MHSPISWQWTVTCPLTFYSMQLLQWILKEIRGHPKWNSQKIGIEKQSYLPNYLSKFTGWSYILSCTLVVSHCATTKGKYCTYLHTGVATEPSQVHVGQLSVLQLGSPGQSAFSHPIPLQPALHVHSGILLSQSPILNEINRFVKWATVAQI